MNNPYDYKNNIKKVITPKGDVVITMNREAYTVLIISLYEAAKRQEEDGRKSTARDTDKLREAIDAREGE